MFASSFMASGSYFQILIYFDLIFVYSVMQWPSLIFAFGSPVFPIAFIEGIILSSLYIVSSVCHKLIDHKCVGLILGSPFCSTDLCVCFFAQHLWNKSHMIMMYYHFIYCLMWFANTVEDFYIYVHQGYWPIIFFLNGILACLWYQGNSGLIKCIWRISPLLFFEKEFENWHGPLNAWQNSLNKFSGHGLCLLKALITDSTPAVQLICSNFIFHNDSILVDCVYLENLRFFQVVQFVSKYFSY